MVLNAAVQMLREADELKNKILKFKSGTSMLQERSLWVTQQQLQKVYQKVLVLDLDYALEKKVEQDLWNVGFKQQIEALQTISKDRKNPQRSEGQAMLSWVLQAAAGYYLCLLHQICTTFKLDLPFRRRASLLGWVEGWGTGAGEVTSSRPPPAAARYICQHCLVHLGDLARYRQQLRVAHTFYRHALVVSVHSGQPYNQLALVSWRRGKRLAALYWHVRSLLVRSPFPPAPANLARTLHAAASGGLSQEPLPVLPGVTGSSTVRAAVPTARLDANGYIAELIRAMHMIHTVEQLDTASSLVDKLNSALPSLVAANSFESMTLVKMSVVVIWLVHSSSEDLELDSGALSEGEAAAVQLSTALAAGLMYAFALVTAANNAATRQLPALKVWLQWCVCQPRSPRSGSWSARAHLWPTLAAALSALAHHTPPSDTHEFCPLPEDEELHGFTPLQAELEPLRFAGDWDTYSGRLPQNTQHEQVWSPGLEDAELQESVRIHRILQLGRRLATLRPDHLTCTSEGDAVSFSSPSGGAEALGPALALLAGRVSPVGSAPDDSDDDPPPPPPPLIISEADFREKVREKRVGILKPQGSLERAREERAMACTQEDQVSEGEDDTSKSEDKKETRKPRVNIAMAAIMRKQEESNKQVKFITPPPTPDSTTDSVEKEQEKPKMIQPKPIKGIVTLPLGRKTGGILSLKDKSAGYPHLVNTDPEPTKKVEEEKKKEPKPNQGSSQGSQGQQKRQDHAPSPNWGSNPPMNTYDSARMNFQKNYGIQNAGITYNPNYPSPTNVNNQGIRLPVVNPKEIDVRSAALQKQTSRADLFQDGHKFNHGYQISGDKKNFLNDLPPRFANQYRYWQTAQENQFNDNKFRDDSFKPNTSLFNSPQNWPPAQPQESYQQPMPWWKDNPPPNFNGGFNQPVNVQPNFYTPHMNSNLSSPYQSLPSFSPMQNQNAAQNQQPNPPNYLQSAIGQPQLQTLQNMAGSSNFNSSLNNFGAYGPNVGYDSTMYPQFGSNKLGFQQMPLANPQLPGFQANKDLMDMSAMNFGSNLMDLQQRNVNMNFSDSLSGDAGKNMDPIGGTEGSSSEVAGNTYSLFSGTPDTTAWGQRQPQQSLWSGPGPSPLERLLEQQKQMKHPPAPQ